MRLPDFLIIGAAKAGTTSLHALLARHPDLFMSDPKEPEFFARDDRYEEGLQRYADLFAKAAPWQLCGESSTLYSHSQCFPNTVPRIAAQLPDVRLIYILRHPVERAYSYYTQLVKNRQNATGEYEVRRSFEECIFPDRFPNRAPAEEFYAPFDRHLPDCPALFLGGSRYADQIAAYRRHYSRERLLFLLFEEFVTDQGAAVRQVLSFLGREILPTDCEGGERRNISRDHFETAALAMRRANLRNSLGPLARLRHWIPKNFRRHLANAFAPDLPAAVRDRHIPAPMLPETRDYLERYFTAQIDACATMTGLDLAAWCLPRDVARSTTTTVATPRARS